MNAMASFLQARRRQMQADVVALPDGRRRRTPGLRREEVAQLAGISTEWYTRLEQGRAGTPSTATVEALARALRLNDVERAHLRTLAARSPRPSLREAVPPRVQRLLESLPDPAYVTGMRWDILAWNAAAAALFDDLEALPSAKRNILLYMLIDARARDLFGATWASEAGRMVALFRSTHDVSSNDPAFVELVEQLRAGCPEFEGWWQQHHVARPTSGSKTLHHPTRGALRFDYVTLHLDDNPALRLSIYLPQS